MDVLVDTYIHSRSFEGRPSAEVHAGDRRMLIDIPVGASGTAVAAALQACSSSSSRVKRTVCAAISAWVLMRELQLLLASRCLLRPFVNSEVRVGLGVGVGVCGGRGGGGRGAMHVMQCLPSLPSLPLTPCLRARLSPCTPRLVCHATDGGGARDCPDASHRHARVPGHAGQGPDRR